MKKYFLLLYSIIFSFTLVYVFFYIYTFLNLEKSIPKGFNTLKSLNFHKKYSDKIHHLRNLKEHKKFKYTEYLYSTISSFKSGQKNILFQGDAWAEELTNPHDGNFDAMNFVKNFSKKNNLGFINAGIVSFSPTLMKLQLETLDKDFGITPNIIIALIDQTDIGDENCRYKNNKVFKNNKLVAVKVENYTGKSFDYSKIYGESQIDFEEKSKLKKTYKILNFRLKYNYMKIKNKNIRKFKRITKYGYKNRKIIKCYVPQIQKYLIDSSVDEIKYFEETVNDYINYIEKKNYIEKLFIVTFPHKNHLPELYESDKLYKYNVSDIIDNLVQNKEKIFHLNFTKLIIEKKIKLKKEDYLKNDPLAHLSSDYYRNSFIKEVINYVFNNLNT